MIKARWVILILSLLSVVIILPPIVHGYIYPTGGDDTAYHLAVIQKITPTQPVVTGTIYAGQWIVGYPIKLLEFVFHVPITTSFLWFNYLALIGIVLTSYFVFSKLVSRVTGIIAALVSFLFSTNVALFQSGAIYDIVNLGIIFPWMLYFTITAIKEKSWKRGVIALLLADLFAVFHANGVYLLVIPLIFALVAWQRKRLLDKAVLSLIIMGVLVIALFIVAFIVPFVSYDAGRQSVDATALIWLMIAMGLGLWLKRMKQPVSVLVIIGLALIGGYLALPSWFSYTSAIKPIDEKVMAYVNTLPEREFYTNEFVAPYVYQVYLNKTYKPTSGIYIWRSVPMTAGVTPGTHFIYWERQGRGKDTKPPENMVNIKNFSEGGITIYVGQATQ